ncbi:MAG: XRE family transcriptional regulator [Mesorhizobium sp.]|uniref:helix-turn-helix transcriptional regulator n=1 Tax=Mesorhizobium sp. TaxID=1871066 RepID=UPI000FE77DE4|nr:helix-turn-helix transcriptional regulator [Mesorhizobium sp.]RWC33317.1 MAG: XRE family transcriptional regulator [Mesorhizobium sp.]
MSDETERWREIGNRLRTAREYVELKQEQAAEAVGLSRSALSLVENGRRKVDAVELSRFARLYGQSIEFLSGEVEPGAVPDSVQALARAATELSSDDRAELLRFAEFLQSRPKGGQNG